MAQLYVPKVPQPKHDKKGNRVCMWEGCSTALSRYNDNIVCRRHIGDYAITYLPTLAPRGV